MAFFSQFGNPAFEVALREEGDRFGPIHALREEGDRFGLSTPSARRATITVALREEGDRFGLHVLDALPVSDFVALREEGDRFGRPPRGGRG